MIHKETARTVLQLIDISTWKHSWHLNKNEYGYTDWGNKSNLDKCLDVAHAANTEATDLLALSDKVITILTAELALIEKQEEIDMAAERR